MSKLQFTSTDFTADMACRTDAVESARRAQAKFDKWLSEAVRVFLYYDDNGKEIQCDRTTREAYHTHTALLVDIQLIKKEPEKCQTCGHTIS